MLRAFRYRNYRLFFGGQIVSLIGTWITLTSTSWLVYRLTNSAFLLGVVRRMVSAAGAKDPIVEVAQQSGRELTLRVRWS